MAPDAAADDQQLSRFQGGRDFAAEGRAAGPEGPEDIRVSRFPFAFGDNGFAVGLEIIHVAMGVLSGGCGECRGVEVEGTAGGGKATEGEKAASVGL